MTEKSALLSFLVLVMSMARCLAPETPPANTAVSPGERPPSSATPLRPTGKPIMTSTAQPTPTPSPTIAAPEAARIQFAPGAPWETFNGHLNDYESDHYVLRAQEGQTLDLVIDAPKQVGLTVVGADGIPLKRYVYEEKSWRGELPTTQDYFIEVNAIEATAYTLTVRLAPPSPEASIAVISPNGGEEWSEGSTHHVAWRSSGVEEVDIEIASGGKPLGHLALAVAAASGQYVWQIPVGLVSDFGVARSDAMRIRISSSEDPKLYDENDEPFTVRCPRIQLQSGTASARITGTLKADTHRFRYALGVSEGRTLEIEISPVQMRIHVWGTEDGSAWELPAGESKLTIPSLPGSQDYFITLTSAARMEAIDYTLDIVIR